MRSLFVGVTILLWSSWAVSEAKGQSQSTIFSQSYNLRGKYVNSKKYTLSYMPEGMPVKYLWAMDEAQRSISRKLASSQKAQVKLSPKTFVLEGNVYPIGIYKATLQFGRSRSKLSLLVDTGSDLLWVRCNAPCVQCGTAAHPPFNPQNSTFTSCKAKICKSAQTGPIQGCDKSGSTKCKYDNQYVGGTLVEGYIIQDVVVLPLANGTSSTVPIVFGCTYYLDDVLSFPDAPDGVLGLGPSDVSVPSQLAKYGVAPVFGHCFAGGRGGGYLFLGPALVPKKKMTWVPFLVSKHNLPHYYASVTSINIGNRLLSVPAGSYNYSYNKENNVHEGGFRFDSGRTYTYFEDSVFQAFADQYQNIVLRNKRVTQSSSDTDPYFIFCWKYSNGTFFEKLKDANLHFPRISFGFGKKSLKVSPENYMVITNDKHLCLGLFPDFPRMYGGGITLGENMMRNYLLVVDRRQRRFGWRARNCSVVP